MRADFSKQVTVQNHLQTHLLGGRRLLASICRSLLCVCLQLRLISDSPERLSMLLASVGTTDADEPSTSSRCLTSTAVCQGFA